MSRVLTDHRIFVTGHNGLLGRAVCRGLLRLGAPVLTCDRTDLDLREPKSVENWFESNRPVYVIHCAGTVGGIVANRDRPVDFYQDNALMQISVLRAAQRCGVQKLLYVGSSCIYPRECPQPIREEYLLTGSLEPTNEAYAIAKISGVKSCHFYRQQFGCNFIAAMPTNLYGPYDNFGQRDSHVLPALIRRFHESKLRQKRLVTVWGSGRPRRELMHVDDCAEACIFLLQNYDEAQPINVGTGIDASIAEIADSVRRIVYPEAQIVFDEAQPDGTMQKILDVHRIRQLGWRHRIELDEGLRATYDWFLQHYNTDGIRQDDTRSAMSDPHTQSD